MDTASPPSPSRSAMQSSRTGHGSPLLAECGVVSVPGFGVPLAPSFGDLSSGFRVASAPAVDPSRARFWGPLHGRAPSHLYPAARPALGSATRTAAPASRGPRPWSASCCSHAIRGRPGLTRRTAAPAATPHRALAVTRLLCLCVRSPVGAAWMLCSRCALDNSFSGSAKAAGPAHRQTPPTARPRPEGPVCWPRPRPRA